jgi:hypothetical protein
MDTPTIRKKIKELSYTVTEKTQELQHKPYILLSISALVFLLIVQPDFVKRQDGFKRKLCLKKILISWLLFSIVLSTGYYAYTN